MSRLPQPGSDQGQWGQILNDFLGQIHNTDGTLKPNVVDSVAIAPNAVNETSLGVTGGTDGQVLVKDTASGTGLAWATPSTTAVSDASTSTKGIVQLAGDLAGSAAAPTVPGLASKLNSSQVGIANGVASLDATGKVPSSQLSVTFPVTAVAGRTGSVTLTKTDVGLENVDNTTDANKPISSATQTALNAKADSSALTTGLAGKVDSSQVGAVNGIASLDASGKVPLTQLQLTFPVTTVAGRTGDVTLTKNDVGLGNVDNTTDANKPISSATQTALNAKANSSHTHAISDVTGLQTAIDGKAATSHTHTASNISDSTAVGRAVLTAADAAAAQLVLGIANTVQVVGSFAEVTTPVYGTLYVVRT